MRPGVAIRQRKAPRWGRIRPAVILAAIGCIGFGVTGDAHAAAAGSPPGVRGAGPVAMAGRPANPDSSGRPEPLTLLWRQHAGRSVAFPPIEAGGALLVAATDGRVSLFALSSGKRIWSRNLRQPASAACAYSDVGGDGGRIYLALESPGQNLRCLDPTKGKDLWGVHLPRPAIQLLARRDRLWLMGRQGRIACRSTADGAELWGLKFGGWSPPGFYLGDSLLFVLAREDSLIALNAMTGRRRWAAVPGGRFAAPPVLSGADLIVVSTDGAVTRFDPGSGASRGRAQGAGPQLTAPVESRYGLVTITSGGRVESRGIGRETWSRDLRLAARAPALATGATVLVASTSGTLEALNAASGDSLWTIRGHGGFECSPAFVADLLVLATDRGEIDVYRRPE